MKSKSTHKSKRVAVSELFWNSYTENTLTLPFFKTTYETFSSLTGISNFSFALFEKQSGKGADRKIIDELFSECIALLEESSINVRNNSTLVKSCQSSQVSIIQTYTNTVKLLMS